jgi:hypothetical protein
MESWRVTPASRRQSAKPRFLGAPKRCRRDAGAPFLPPIMETEGHAPLSRRAWGPTLAVGGSAAAHVGGIYIPGTLIASLGSCPWPGSWSRAHGAHLVYQVRGDLNASTVFAAPPPVPRQ